MKIQDVIFFIILAVAAFQRKPKLAAILGLACLILSIPLFSLWVFFTAERLTWYAAAFFLLSMVLSLIQLKDLKGDSSPRS